MSLLSEWDSEYARMRDTCSFRKSSAETAKSELQVIDNELQLIESPDSDIHVIIDDCANKINNLNNIISTNTAYINEIDLTWSVDDRNLIDEILQIVGVDNLHSILSYVIHNGFDGLKTMYNSRKSTGLNSIVLKSLIITFADS